MGENYYLVDSTGNATEISGELKIGRNKTNGLVLSDPLASRHHATVYMQDEVLMIRDEDSVNGTYVNNEQIYDPVTLKDLDKVQFGDEVYVVRAPLAESKTIRAGESEANGPDLHEQDSFEEEGQKTVLAGEVEDVDQADKKSVEGANFKETGTSAGTKMSASNNRRLILIIVLVVILFCACCLVMIALPFLFLVNTSRVIEAGAVPLFEISAALIAMA